MRCAPSAAEFILEGLYAHRRISRNEERGFAAEEKRERDASRARSERTRQNGNGGSRKFSRRFN